MITIGYCIRKSDKKVGEHLIKTCGLDPKKIELIEIVNTGDRSLTECYNEILKTAKYNYVVFTHSDLTLKTKQWGNKIVKLFEKNPEYGILGVAGTKNLPSSGMWWEDRSKMYGRVEHTHEGKTWLSAYSDDMGNDVEEVVIVDGLFFSVHKGRLKEGFDLDVKGFHFYEIDFCFRNYLKGVKVGVHTNVRVNHMSIGQTNTEWDENRVRFADKYKENLPITVKKTFRPNQKMKVLVGSLNMDLSDARGKFTFELIKRFRKDGHLITLCSLNHLNDKKLVSNHGIRCFSLSEPPNFKLGDGKWTVKINNKLEPSNPKTLYKVADEKFDLIHLFDDQLIEHFSKLYSDTPIIGNKYTDGLFFINGDIDSRLSNTLELDSDVSKIKNDDFINNVYSKYSESL